MRRHITLTIIALMSFASLQADEVAERILEGVRIGATLQKSDLQGQLRKGKTKSPVSLFMRGANMQFRFTEGNGEARRFHMRHGPGDLDIFEINDAGKTVRFPKSKLKDTIAETDVNFEDLSLRFLYWPNPSLEGEELVNGQKCWKIRVNNPGSLGPYSVVYVWVQKKYNALWRIAGYGAGGKLKKQFEIIKLMKIGKDYTVQKIRISPFDDSSGRFGKPTYLEFFKSKSKPRVGP